MNDKEIEYITNKTESEINNVTEQISAKKQDIKYDTRDYNIQFLANQFEEEEYYIPLEYQRNFIWNDEDRCFFIESLLMGLPIPFMFFADTEDGRIEIVDGAQRVQTIALFMQNELELRNLKVLKSANGFRFGDFHTTVQRRIKNIPIRVVFLEEGTTESVRQEIFKRINTGGQRLTPTESRRGSFSGGFKDFVEECVKDPLFNKLAPRTAHTEKRYEGYELVSRFFAYLENFDSQYSDYTGSVTMYIDNYIDNQNKKFSEGSINLEEYKIEFINMLTYAEKLLGEKGFRKVPTAKSTPRARFEALSVGIALALRQNSNLPVVDAKWITTDDFAYHTKSDAANNKSRLIGRIKYVRDMLLKGDNNG